MGIKLAVTRAILLIRLTLRAARGTRSSVNTSQICLHSKILGKDFEYYFEINRWSLKWEGDVFSSVVFVLSAGAAFHLLAAEGSQAVAILRGQT